MYFPSLGFCICIAVLYNKLFRINTAGKKFSFGNPRFFSLYIILCLFAYQTVTRNNDWKDNYTLYSHDVLLSPNSVKAHYYLGLELTKVIAEKEKDENKKRRIYEEGLRELEKAVQIMPTFSSAYSQMGVAYYRLKNYEKAIENYEKSISLSPGTSIVLNNIGTVYFEWGKYHEAIEKFKQAVTADARYVDGYLNLGSAYGTLGEHYRNGNQPQKANEQFENAIKSFLEAIRHAPDNARAHFFLASTYRNVGDLKNAEKHFQIARQLDPNLKQ
jgi:tetratricopeptide (TPR) repeat protein